MSSLPTDAPPSYEDVVNKFNGLVGGTRDPKAVLDVADCLSAEELEILTANHSKDFPLKTENDTKQYVMAATETSSSPEMTPFLTLSANAASQVAANVSHSFNRVQFLLAKVDQHSRPSFESKFITIKSGFQDTVDESRSVAAKMAASVALLDSNELPYAHDARASVAGRITKLEKYIKTSEELQSASTGVTDKLTRVTTSLDVFTTEFLQWSEDKEGELTEKIRIIKQQLVSLARQLGEAETSLATMTHLSQGVAPIMTALGAAFPPYSGLIAIGGLLISGLSLAATTALVHRINSLKSDIAAKTKEKEELGAELEAVRQAREEVEQTQTANISSFGDCIAAMPAVSISTVDEAKSVLSWLKDGADDNNRTLYAQMNLNNNVRSYRAMSTYLQTFASAISPLCSQPEPKE
ncbi:hypothetical protein VHEMI03960 [[Torrubiella] hemipterigena]|uniref:Uncharacterized protein n=1 Tax=[Torrubiella] hemipterigena TaxID=1531966 RepID=A0A0A1TEY5_9HYPO|nr:hypothetical protein VHEMI03960 [[Torrubiella] hemipterigena]